MIETTFPLLRQAFKKGPFQILGGWAHAIPKDTRDEIVALLAQRDALAEAWNMTHFDCNNDDHAEAYKMGAEALFGEAVERKPAETDDKSLIRRVLSVIHGQNARRMYSVAEVKELVYPLINALGMHTENKNPDFPVYDADDLGRVIWETSRADEGSISVTGAKIVAQAVLTWVRTLAPQAVIERDEFSALVLAERQRQVSKGYTAERDGQRVEHLLRWAQEYARRGERIKSAAMVEAAREAFLRVRLSTEEGVL